MLDAPASQCMFAGQRGSCIAYAEDLAQCGGTLQSESPAACTALCAATVGAWSHTGYQACASQCN